MQQYVLELIIAAYNSFLHERFLRMAQNKVLLDKDQILYELFPQHKISGVHEGCISKPVFLTTDSTFMQLVYQAGNGFI